MWQGIQRKLKKTIKPFHLTILHKQFGMDGKTNNFNIICLGNKQQQ